MMDLCATVCLLRTQQCIICSLSAMCDTRGEHPTAPRPRMLSEEVARSLSVRLSPGSKVARREVLLELRPDSETVMPGMWELPLLHDADVPDQDLRMTVRHAIMQVNYYVRIRSVPAGRVRAMTVESGERRWVPL